MSTNHFIQHNIQAHDRVVDSYERTHGEIYNPIEQDRLHRALQNALQQITSAASSQHPQALDVGCGAGNLTDHLLQLGCSVTAADVSTKFLQKVQERYAHHGDALRTAHLNGVDLQPIPDNTFDIVATYSVLHHIPDYLGTVAEMMRVLKPGGIVYLDHEPSTVSWTPSATYAEFLQNVQPPQKKEWKRFFRWWNYSFHLHRLFDKRYMPEGDIHVFPDDHVEWDRVSSVIMQHGGEVLSLTPFLLYKKGYDKDVYTSYRDRCSDMAYLIARKR